MPIAAEKTIEMMMEFGETRVGQPMCCEIPTAEPTPSASPSASAPAPARQTATQTAIRAADMLNAGRGKATPGVLTSPRRVIDHIREAGLGQAEVDAVLGGNARRLFNLEGK